MTPLVISVVVMWMLLIMLGIALLALYRHFGLLYMNEPRNKAEQGPPVGTPLSSLGRVDTRGREVYAPSARDVVLLFADTECDLCAELRGELAHVELEEELEVIVLCAGSRRDVNAWAASVDPRVHVIWDQRSRLASRYQVNGTPFAVVVARGGGVIGKSIINGRQGLEWATMLAGEHELVQDLKPPPTHQVRSQ